jgi:thymidylate synthase
MYIVLLVLLYGVIICVLTYRSIGGTKGYGMDQLDEIMKQLRARPQLDRVRRQIVRKEP